MYCEGKVGIHALTDGATNELRLDRTGALAVANARGKYTELTRNGNVFWLQTASITVAAANATGGALGTFKSLNGIYNPPTSGKNAAVLRGSIATVSGTPAGPLFWEYVVRNLTQAATGTIRAALLSQSAAASAMQAAADVIIASTGDTTTVGTKLGILGGPAAIAAGAGLYTQHDQVDGCIIVPPGAGLFISATGAGTSHVMQSTIVWEEFPV